MSQPQCIRELPDSDYKTALIRPNETGTHWFLCGDILLQSEQSVYESWHSLETAAIAWLRCKSYVNRRGRNSLKSGSSGGGEVVGTVACKRALMNSLTKSIPAHYHDEHRMP